MAKAKHGYTASMKRLRENNPAMRNDRVDNAVLKSLSRIGGGAVLSAIVSGTTLFTDFWVDENSVSLSLRRLARKGLVGLHNGHGQMAQWDPNIRCRYWSTAETLLDDYGYFWLGRWESADRVLELLLADDENANWRFDEYTTSRGLPMHVVLEKLVAKTDFEPDPVEIPDEVMQDYLDGCVDFELAILIAQKRIRQGRFV